MSSLRTNAALLIGVIALGSCTSMQETFLRPSQEDPIDSSDSYLSRAKGPQSTVNLGAGEEQLLTRFQAVLEEKETLEKRQKELEEEVASLRDNLGSETGEHAKQVRLRAGAEAEAERLRHIKNERELKVLHLQMQVAELQRTNLELEIIGLEREIETMTQASEPASPASGER